MSAESSPILGNKSNNTNTEEHIIDLNSLESEHFSFLTTDKDQPSPIINSSETLTSPDVEKMGDEDITTLSSIKREETANADDQIAEIAQLQEQLLSNKQFDINDLEATSAGPQDSYSLSSTEKSTSSPLYVESDIVNFDLIDLSPTPSINTNSSATPHTDSSTYSNLLKETESFSSESNDKQSDDINVDAQVNEDLFTVRAGRFENTSLDAGSINGDFGTLDYELDGSWRYTLDNQNDSVQSLGANQSALDQFKITTKSGEIFELNILIHGTNDAPIINGDTHSEVNTLSNFESGDRPETVNGKLDISDKDDGQSQFIASDELNATYGQASISESGEWSYALDSQLESIKNLKEGETLTDSITVLSKDGSSQEINVTILGADDKPILSGQNSESINISEQSQISEKLSIIDPDFGESSFVAKSDIQSENGFGTGSIDANGNWSFTVDGSHPKVSNLEEEGQLLDFFMVKTADGTEQSIIIKIQNNETTPNSELASTTDNSFGAQISLIENSEEQTLLDTFNSTNEDQHNASITYSNSNTSISASNLDSSLVENHILGHSNSIDTV